MSDLPFGATDAPSADGWFSGLAESLEELLGAQGAQAVLSRALEDARRTWPQLSRVTLGSGGFDFSVFHSAYPAPRGKGFSLESATALQGLVDSLNLLLECLLGRQLASELMAWQGRSSSTDQEDGRDELPFSGCA